MVTKIKISKDYWKNTVKRSSEKYTDFEVGTDPEVGDYVRMGVIQCNWILTSVYLGVVRDYIKIKFEYDTAHTADYWYEVPWFGIYSHTDKKYLKTWNLKIKYSPESLERQKFSTTYTLPSPNKKISLVWGIKESPYCSNPDHWWTGLCFYNVEIRCWVHANKHILYGEVKNDGNVQFDGKLCVYVGGQKTVSEDITIPKGSGYSFKEEFDVSNVYNADYVNYKVTVEDGFGNVLASDETSASVWKEVLYYF